MPTPPAEAPLIVTVHFDEASFAALDALRRRYFPAKLNKVPAHISLFHKLPGYALPSIGATLTALCRRHQAFDLEPSGLRSLGRGVAITYASPLLDAIRGELARSWDGWLSAQDRQHFAAHVTIQNKVEPAAARALMDGLATGFEPPVPHVEGLSLWLYRDGPWQAVETYRFATGEYPG